MTITDDYTIKERETIKKWYEIATRRNDSDKDNHWVIRGNPRTGMDIVKRKRWTKENMKCDESMTLRQAT